MIKIYATNIDWDGNSAVLDRAKLEELKESEICLEQYKRSAISKNLVQVILTRYFHFNNSEIQIVRDKYGKPLLYVKGIIDSNIHFNISHSGKWVVCAISNQPIGIDIEKISNYSPNVAKRFFSESEYNYYLNSEDKDKLFFDIWTLKESYAKALGKGLRVPFPKFSFNISESKIGFQSEIEDENWYFKQYDISKGYCLSICALSTDFPVVVEKIPLL